MGIYYGKKGGYKSLSFIWCCYHCHLAGEEGGVRGVGVGAREDGARGEGVCEAQLVCSKKEEGLTRVLRET